MQKVFASVCPVVAVSGRIGSSCLESLEKCQMFPPLSRQSRNSYPITRKRTSQLVLFPSSSHPRSMCLFFSLVCRPYLFFFFFFREKAVVEFPNRHALQAIQEIPTYKTVEVPKPSFKKEEEELLEKKRHPAEDDKAHGEGKEEDEDTKPAPAVPSKPHQHDDDEEEEAEDDHKYGGGLPRLPSSPPLLFSSSLFSCVLVLLAFLLLREGQTDAFFLLSFVFTRVFEKKVSSTRTLRTFPSVCAYACGVYTGICLRIEGRSRCGWLVVTYYPLRVGQDRTRADTDGEDWTGVLKNSPSGCVVA